MSSAETSRSPWPPIAEVVPQKPPMVLLDEIVAHDEQATACVVRIQPTSPFADEEGAVPIAVALEYMAQCAAARSGLQLRARGEPVGIGLLLGSRKIRFHAPRLIAGQLLEVRVRDIWSDGELASFACEVGDAQSGQLLAECALNALRPQNLASILGERPQ